MSNLLLRKTLPERCVCLMEKPSCVRRFRGQASALCPERRWHRLVALLYGHYLK